MLPFYESLAERFHDLHEQIRNDLNTLPLEALDWIPGHEMNSINILITHLTGAERFLIGDVVMQDPSNRDRDAEFLARGLSKADLNRRLDETEAYVTDALTKLTMEDLSTERLHPRHGNQVIVGWALLHALDHVATHLGHINITVQLWHQHSVGG
jgi:hypothetical protein